jgi:hypothetical protein
MRWSIAVVRKDFMFGDVAANRVLIEITYPGAWGAGLFRPQF